MRMYKQKYVKIQQFKRKSTICKQEFFFVSNGIVDIWNLFVYILKNEKKNFHSSKVYKLIRDCNFDEV